MEEPRTPSEGESDEPIAQTVGIVVVHGVIPHPRYQMQDEAAQELARALRCDERWGRRGRWVTSVLNPHEPAVRDTLTPRPTISRVRRHGMGAVHTKPPYFDVIEAYWSPLDKGKTTFAKLVAWLFRTVMVPLNTTARYMAKPWKTAYDVVFVVVALLVIMGALIGALLLAASGLLAILQKFGACGTSCATLYQVMPLLLARLGDPKKVGDILPAAALAALAAGVVGAVLVGTGVKGLASMVGQRDVVGKRPAQLLDRLRLIAAVLIAGGLLVWFSAMHRISGQVLGGSALLFVWAALMLELGLTVAKSFVVNFFGDVQIYTTRDQNSEFFAIREQMLDCVTTTIARACSKKANGGEGYDRVFVLAHSLGSTIALDAILRLANLAEQDPAAAAGSDESVGTALRRLRAFVTFGSPLEKTKYFTDVLDPSPSAARDQWRDDLYGSLFTADHTVLDQPNNDARGIFWGNYWYCADVIANELVSYRSFVPPGKSSALGHTLRRLARGWHAQAGGAPGGVAIGRRVCRNARGHKGLQIDGILPHGDYLGDPWFWHSADGKNPYRHLGVLDVVARWSDPGYPALKGTAFASAVGAHQHEDGFTYELVSRAEASKYFDRASLAEDEDAP